MKENIMLPESRKKGLIVQESSDEVVVYDTERHKAHCLTPAVARVWQSCDGTKGVPEISNTLRDSNVPADEEMVWMMVHRLGKLDLLVQKVPVPAGALYSSRREVAQRLLALGGVSAILTATQAAPTAASAQSGGPEVN
jgi:hypothetical protein